MGENPIQISEWLDAIFVYGPFWVYAAIFFACFVENIFPPFPGDSFILAAGGLVAVGRLQFVPAFLVVVVGGLASVMLLHQFGSRRGRGYFMRKNFRYFTADDIKKMEERFRRSGALILVVSRFVVGLRSALAVAAGISDYRAGKMLFFSAISYFLFGGLLMYISITLVENLDLLLRYMRAYNLILWPVVILLVILIVVWKLRNGKRKAI